jgi:hypothetical protein
VNNDPVLKHIGHRPVYRVDRSLAQDSPQSSWNLDFQVAGVPILDRDERRPLPVEINDFGLYEGYAWL